MSWRSNCWLFVFSSALNLHNNERENYVNALSNMGSLFPDEDARNKYNSYLSTHPITPSTDIFNWLLSIHNIISPTQKTREQIINELNNTYKVGTTSIRVGKIIRTITPKPRYYTTPSSNVPRRKGGCGCGGRR